MSDKNSNKKKKVTLQDLDEAVLKKNRELHSKKSYDRYDQIRKEREEKIEKYRNDRRIIQENRRKRKENDTNNRYALRSKLTVGIGVISLFMIFFLMQCIMPGSLFRKKGWVGKENATSTDATPIISENIEETLKPEKNYTSDEEENEKQRLWNLLLKHYDGNINAVLGVMCNLYSESRFESSNLEDYNNDIWELDDNTYTDYINRGEISKQDFLEARTYEMTNGYYNDYSQWVNVDGGYGYAQYTAYIKKEELYQFAEQWFGPGGKGENYRFNIGDPEMQAHYLIYLLENDEFQTMDTSLKNSQTVVDACYYWLKYYEVPYDPYCDNYYTLSFERAAHADEIKAECSGKDGGE